MSRRPDVLTFLVTSLQRALAFSLLFSLSLVLLYALGNYQGFLDTTQLLLLDVVGLSLWAACLSSATVLVLLVAKGIRDRRFVAVRFVATLLALGLSVALAVSLEFLAAWIGG